MRVGAYANLGALMILAELVPFSLFQSISQIYLWLIIAGAMTVLVIGADKAVAAAARLASELGISKIIIGATVVSLGTTAPEVVVSVKAALGGDSGLSLGNGMGSVICDTALIFGLCCFIKPLPIDKFIMKRQGWFQFGSGVLLALLIAGSWLISGDINSIYVGTASGGVLILLLMLYLCLSARWGKQHANAIPEMDDDIPDPDHVDKSLKATFINLFWLAIGLSMIVAGAEFLIGSVKQICYIYQVPESVIASTVVAFGTSLPELVTALTALKKGHSELLIGNVIGADILNIFFVIGASALAVPLKVDKTILFLTLPTMLIVLFMLRGFASMNKKPIFKRWQGFALLMVYIVFSMVFGNSKQFINWVS